MFKFILITISFIICQSTLYAASPSANSGVILVYHHVSNDTPKTTSVAPDIFEQQLDYLHSNGFTVWPLPKLVEHIYENKNIPDKVAVISFDDAYQSVYDEAYPRLKKFNYPFTIFVTTDSVDKQFNKQLSWDKLKIMSENGATIANHTVNHPHMLRHLPDESEDQWLTRMEQEIAQAQSRIKEKIGSNHKLFAYPYGEHNKALKKRVREMGYTAFGQQSGAFGPLIEAQIIPRFPVSGDYTNLKDIRLKTHTKALPAKEISATDNPITINAAKPSVTLAFDKAVHKAAFQCYGPGGKLNISWQDNDATITSNVDIPAGRSRYNCTLPAADKRYYWYSKAWVRLKANGEWILD